MPAGITWPQSHLPIPASAVSFSAPPQFPSQSPQFLGPPSLLPQHFVQEFLRLSTPVGQLPDDDTILAQALYDSRQNGKTYRQALEGLHGVNNHAANLWKDYYLDHHDRIEILVSRLSQQTKTVKKPFTRSISPPAGQSDPSSSLPPQKRKFSSPTSPAPPSPKPRGRSSPSRLVQRERPSRIQPAPVVPVPRPQKRVRSTFNSISASVPTATAVRGLTPPHVDILVPDPPSRSPSPPAKVQSSLHGNRYTQEDRDYFIKFITWRLKQDPSLKKRQLCEQLAEKAPHHSAVSWASHWHSRHDVADKILATYWHRAYDGPSPAANPIEDAREHHTQDETSDSGPPGLDFDLDTNTDDDEAEMGEPGTAFTRGDWCILARFIARTNWHEMTSRERFDEFVETHETDRSAKSWAEFYRRNESALLKLAKKYTERARESEDIRSRRALPSWAQKRDSAEDQQSDHDGGYDIDERNEGGKQGADPDFSDVTDHHRYQLYRKFRPGQAPPSELGRDRDYAVDLIPKFIIANGELTKILVHTDVTRYLEFKQIAGSFVYRDGKISKVPSTEIEAVKSPLMGLFEKRRAKKFFEFLQSWKDDDPATHQGKNFIDKMP
ncbi:hypothetical protein ID866_1167 [Astraeus odoratus]|nr:hypothetical protein ID866_1167 [Astraeus odoratus]